VESGFDALRASEAEKSTEVREHVQGWRNELGELTQYVEALAP
jgi:hypothetical protein